MKTVIQEEDPAQNRMMHGMIEEQGEDLVEKVSELEEKPQIEAERVGRLTKPLESTCSAAVPAVTQQVEVCVTVHY